MALNDILIKIRTSWEGQGAQSAAKGLSDIESAASRAAPAVNKAAGATRVSAEEFSRAAKMASAAGGSIEGIGAMIQQLGSRISGFAAAIPVIGLLVAAFEAWKTAITGIIEAQKAQAAGLRDIKASNMEGVVRGLAASYADLQKSIAEAGEEQKRFVDGQQAIADAQKALTLANIDAAEQDALIKEADPLKQAAIKARFAEQRANANTTYDTETEARKADMLGRQISLAEIAQQTAAAQVSALQAEFASTSHVGGILAEKQRVAMNSAWTELGAGIAGAEWQPERDRNLKGLQDIAAQIKEARKTESDSRRDAESARTLLDAQLIRVQASRVSGATSTRSSSASVIGADNAITAAELVRQRSSAEEQLRQAQDQNVNAQAFVDGTQARIDAGTYSFSDNANALQALAASQEQTVLLRNYLEQIGRELSKQNEILRNNAMIH